MKREKKYLNGYRLVFEALEPESNIIIITLQQPLLHYYDCYSLLFLDDDRVGETLEALEKLDKLHFQSYITGKIEYTYDEKSSRKLVLNLRIDRIEIENN